MKFFQISYLWRAVTLNSKPPTIPFGTVACTFSDDLSLNSCIRKTYKTMTAWLLCYIELKTKKTNRKKWYILLRLVLSANKLNHCCNFLDCYKVWNWKYHKNSFRLRELRSTNHVPFFTALFFAIFYMTIMEVTNVKDSKLTGTNCFQLLLKIRYAPQDSDPRRFEKRMPSGNRALRR